MGEMFDRNVHPLYSVIAYVCALVVLLLLVSVSTNKKEIEKNHKKIYFWVIFFCVQDGTWGLFASHVLYNDFWLFVFSNIFHISAILSAFAWTLYFLSRLWNKSRHVKNYYMFSGMLVLTQFCMVVVNLFNKFMFYVDGNGWYQTTDYRAILFYLQFATYILIGLISLKGLIRAKGADRKSLSIIILVNMAPLLFGIFQMIYPDAPADSIGFSIGCVIIELFMSREYEEQVYTLEQLHEELSDYKKALLSDALVALEINLSRNELYYGTWKDDEGKEISLKDILGLEVPCSYDEYVEKWNEKFVKEGYSNDFLKKTSREYLIDKFNNGVTEVSWGYEAKTISGKEIWIRWNICMIRNQMGDIIAFTNVKDISELVEISRREEDYVSSMATEYESIVIVGIGDDRTEDMVLFHSRLSENILPLIDEATVNEKRYSKKLEHLVRFVHPDDREQFCENIKREKVLESFEMCRTHTVQFRIGKEEGMYLYYQLSFIPITDKNGKTVRTLACMRNIDEEIRKEVGIRKELEDAKIAAEAANHAKTAFLFNMSHDIRTPMNAILGYTDIALKHRDNQDRVNDCLIKTKRAGEHLLNLINDILEMSRIESGRFELAQKPMKVATMIECVEQLSSALAIRYSIDFCMEIGDFNNPYVYADDLHLNEVLINLISNAMKYTPEGGKVRFRANQIGDVVDGKAIFSFEVEDNGIGMSEEFQKHLFESFSREQSTTVSKIEGSGLGLSIVKEIIELAGGTISVNSKLNEGTTFRVEIPMDVMDEKAIEEYESNNASIDVIEVGYELHDKKVLLVDDNEMNREIAAEILGDVGMIVETAEDGEFAVRKVVEKGIDYYDYILMDVQMPVMDGYSATKAIRALPNGDKLKIIALSANAFEEDVQKSLEVGMNAHVAKPIDIKTLLDTIQGLIEQD